MNKIFIRILGTPGGNEHYYVSKKKPFRIKVGGMEQMGSAVPKGTTALRPIPSYSNIINAFEKNGVEKRISWWPNFESSSYYKRSVLRHIPGLAVIRNFRLIRRNKALYEQAVEDIKKGLKKELSKNSGNVYLFAFSLATELCVEAILRLIDEGNPNTKKLRLILLAPVLNGVFLNVGYMKASHTEKQIEKLAKHIAWGVELRDPRDMLSSFTNFESKNWFQMNHRIPSYSFQVFKRHLGIRKLKSSVYKKLFKKLL